MTLPLEGIRILDLTTMISGPFATMLLGDQGADIIKIEQPGRGDQMRHYGIRSGGLTAPFANNNRNKRSLALDLGKPEAREVVYRFARTADVVVQNFRPGVVERLRVDAATLTRHKPDLVYVSISGFGDAGPLSQKPAYDPIIQAISGLATIQAGSDLERPRMIRAMLPDKLAALTVAQAICAGLLKRQRTGKGEHIHLSMLDAVLAFLWSGEMDNHTFVGQEVTGPEKMSQFDLIYETADGYICIAVVTDKHWRAFAQCCGHAEWLDDPRFNTAAAREKNRDQRLALMQETLRGRNTADWTVELEQADVPCSPVLTRRGVVHLAHVAEQKSLIEFETPGSGRIRQARHPLRFESSETDVRYPPPRLGEHTRQLLSEAGYTDSEIDELVTSGAAGI